MNYFFWGYESSYELIQKLEKWIRICAVCLLFFSACYSFFLLLASLLAFSEYPVVFCVEKTHHEQQTTTSKTARDDDDWWMIIWVALRATRKRTTDDLQNCHHLLVLFLTDIIFLTQTKTIKYNNKHKTKHKQRVISFSYIR